MTRELGVRGRRLWEKFAGDGEPFAEYQICRGRADIRLDRSAYGQHGAREAPEPLMRLFSSQRDQSFLQAAMESLDHPVRLGMVRSCHDGFDSPGFGQLLENFRAKLRSAIRSDGGGDAEILNPTKSESVDDALG